MTDMANAPGIDLPRFLLLKPAGHFAQQHLRRDADGPDGA